MVARYAIRIPLFSFFRTIISGLICNGVVTATYAAAMCRFLFTATHFGIILDAHGQTRGFVGRSSIVSSSIV